MSYHIIGDPDTVLGYRFAGVTGDAVENAEQAREAFNKALSSEEPGILLLTQPIEDMIEEEVTAHRLTSKPPYVAVVPDIWGGGRKRKSLQETISEAVGIKIVESD
ncbi:MAG: V-type ATP synthase subunit F [Victivallales bacterium]|nr:V-type ATP synthase subunit F [Victivallales bacterium]